MSLREWSTGTCWICILPETKPLVIQFNIICLEIVVVVRCFAIPATSVAWNISSFPLGQVVISTWRSRSKKIQETNWGAEWCGLNVFCHQQDFIVANSHVPVWTSRVAWMTLQFLDVCTHLFLGCFCETIAEMMGPKIQLTTPVGMLEKTPSMSWRIFYPSCSITSFIFFIPLRTRFDRSIWRKCVKNWRQKKKCRAARCLCSVSNGQCLDSRWLRIISS